MRLVTNVIAAAVYATAYYAIKKAIVAEAIARAGREIKEIQMKEAAHA